MTLTSGCVKIQKTLRLYIVRLERVELVSDSDVLNDQNISRATGKTELKRINLPPAATRYNT